MSQSCTNNGLERGGGER